MSPECPKIKATCSRCLQPDTSQALELHSCLRFTAAWPVMRLSLLLIGVWCLSAFGLPSAVCLGQSSPAKQTSNAKKAAPPTETWRRYQQIQPHMGTQFSIQLYAPSKAGAAAALAAINKRIAQIEQAMSDYRPTSEIRQLAARAATQVKINTWLHDDALLG